MPRAILVSLLVLAAAAPADAATTRYASPSGTGDCSAAATACSLKTAFDGASSGDTVLVAAGTYGTTGDPLTTLDDGGRDLTVAGAVIGPGRPVLNEHALLLSDGSVARDLALTTSDGTTPLQLTNATGDRLAAEGTGTGCLVRGGLLSNATCRGDEAIFDDGGDVYGVTTRGANGFTTGDGAVVTNTAISGSFQDIGPHAGIAAGSADIDHSAFDDADTGQNVTNKVAPLVPRSGGDLRQDPASPTIGAGLGDPAPPGALDLNGNLRVIGAVDVGAYEHVPAAPDFGELAPEALTTASATVRAALANAGGRTDYRVEYGPTTGYGSSTDAAVAPGSSASQTVGVALTGLAADTTYHYRFVGSSDGGDTTGPDRTFRTAAPAATPSPSPAPSPSPSPAPTAAPKLAVGFRVANASVKDRLSLKRKAVSAIVRCRNLGCGVVARAVVKAGRRTLGRLGTGRATLAAGERGTLRLAVPRKLRKRLPGNARVRVTVVVTGADGTKVTRSLTFRVRRLRS